MKLAGHPNLENTYQRASRFMESKALFKSMKAMNLSGYKYHIGGSSGWYKDTLGFREYLFGQREQAIQENSGEYLLSNG